MKHLLYLALIIPVLFLAQGCQEDEPSFISVDPEFGSEKQLIVLKGEHIGEIRELLFNGEPIPFNTAYNSDVALLFRIPVGTPLGQTVITVRTDGGSFTFDFLVSEKPPVIAKFEPRSGDPGDVITIIGENFFEPPLIAYFRNGEVLDEELEIIDSIPGDIIYVSETKDTMRVIVPEGASTGTLAIDANGGPVASLVNFFTFGRQLVTDFDGNGLRSDNGELTVSGRYLDQLSTGFPMIRNSLPAPIEGNFLQLSGQVGRPNATTVGSIAIPAQDSFGIAASIGNAFIELDVNSGGRPNSFLKIALLEQVERSSEFVHTIKLDDAAGWKSVRIPMVRFKDFNNIVVTPGRVNGFKFILEDSDKTGQKVEANIDNLRLVEQQ